MAVVRQFTRLASTRNALAQTAVNAPPTPLKAVNSEQDLCGMTFCQSVPVVFACLMPNADSAICTSGQKQGGPPHRSSNHV